MGESTDAKRSIESSARHMSDIAQELSRRASPRYLGDQAKEIALHKTMEWKEQILSSRLALGLMGGALGAAICGSLAKTRGRRYSEPAYPDLRFRGDPPSGNAVSAKITEGAQELKQKAGDLVAGVREHLPSAAELGRKADDNPLLIALGGLALGAVAALLLPVTRQERDLLDPVKERASAVIGTLGEKLGETAHQAQEAIAGTEKDSSSESTQRNQFPPELEAPHLSH